MYGLGFYKWLLHFYPRAFREQYGDEIAQVFADCCRDAYRVDGTLGLVRWWLAGYSDLLVNLVKARWAQPNKLGFLGHPALTISTGVAFLLASWAALFWCMAFMTVFMLIPWDIGIRPEGMLASAVDAFFQADHSRMWLPGFITFGLSFTMFVRGIRSWNAHFISEYLWRYAASSMVMIAVGGLAAATGMLVLRQIFPNLSTFEGDQSHNIALVYFGMVVIGGLMSAPLWFQSRLSGTQVEVIEREIAT